MGEKQRKVVWNFAKYQTVEVNRAGGLGSLGGKFGREVWAAIFSNFL